MVLWLLRIDTEVSDHLFHSGFIIGLINITSTSSVSGMTLKEFEENYLSTRTECLMQKGDNPYGMVPYTRTRWLLLYCRSTSEVELCGVLYFGVLSMLSMVYHISLSIPSLKLVYIIYPNTHILLGVFKTSRRLVCSSPCGLIIYGTLL